MFLGPSSRSGAATEKAKDLVRMAVARARLLEPLYEIPFEVDQRALVSGGGLAGLTAALNLADQGFETFLIERSAELGGMARRSTGPLKGWRFRIISGTADRTGEVSIPGSGFSPRPNCLETTGHVGQLHQHLFFTRGKRGRWNTGPWWWPPAVRNTSPENMPTAGIPGILTQLEFRDVLCREPGKNPGSHDRWS